MQWPLHVLVKTLLNKQTKATEVGFKTRVSSHLFFFTEWNSYHSTLQSLFWVLETLTKLYVINTGLLITKYVTCYYHPGRDMEQDKPWWRLHALIFQLIITFKRKNVYSYDYRKNFTSTTTKTSLLTQDTWVNLLFPPWPICLMLFASFSLKCVLA